MRLTSLRYILIVILYILVYIPIAQGQAANVYITPTGTSTGGCPTGANTHNLAFFNTAGNWGTGAAQIGPGTIVLACGTFTSAAGVSAFVFQAGGTSLSPITLLFDTGAIVQAPYFPLAGGININSQSNVVVDGGTNGIIRNTANGSPSLGFANQQDSYLVASNNGGNSNVTIKHLQMLNAYVHAPTQCLTAYTNCQPYGSSGTNPNDDNNGFTTSGINLRGVTNVTVGPGNVFNNCSLCFQFSWDGGESNIVATGNTWTNYNQAMQWGPSNTGGRNVTNITIDHNVAIPTRVWDATSNAFHHNFFHIFTDCGTAPQASILGTLLFYDNSVRGDMGFHSTSLGMYIEVNNGCGAVGFSAPWYTFNNILEKTNTDSPGTTGMLATFAPNNGFVLNSTFWDHGSLPAQPMVMFNMGGTGWTVKNTIFYSGAGFYQANNNTTNPETADFNMYFSNPAGAQWTWAPGSGGFTTNFGTISPASGWRGFCQCDGNSKNGVDPVFNTTTLAATGPVVFGANLTSMGIAALNQDYLGQPRPTSGAWTLGAINLGTTPPVKPNPPTNVLAVPN